ncbi:potassium channel family protein [Amycolatopsis panacis]|uniref:potassium channel family protein n=1 Tax=Amycolatopsis panacis TaxID=2340917 RepID=UPI001F1CA3D8|nr:potassium channel family protein [Amycolatopsis panacis]
MPDEENGHVGVSRLRMFVLGVTRPLATVVLLVVAYYVLPSGRRLDHGDVWLLAVGLVLVTALLAWNVRRILRSRHPVAQGIQTLALVIPLFLLIFAYVYVVVGEDPPLNFSMPLTKTNALYFTVTVFSTVGFGDITPVTEGARVLVTIQMVCDLLVLGGVFQVVVTAVRRARAASPGAGQPDARPHRRG